MIGGKEYWFALYRPSEHGNSTMRLAVSPESLGGPWKDAGLYMGMDPDRGWLGASAYVAEMPVGEEHRWDFTLYHKATYRDPEQKTSKYYDIRILVTDRNDPGRYYASEPILMPEQGYELQGWVPGAIYSCGAILTDHDPETGEYSFDVYYSGSDTAVLLANIGIKLEDDAPAADAAEKTPIGDPVEASREEFGAILERFGTIEDLFRGRDLSEMRGHVVALGKMVDDWDVTGGEGFGVSEQTDRLVEELSHIKENITRYQVNNYDMADRSTVYDQLKGGLNTSRIYLDIIQRRIASPLGPSEAARFFKPLPYKTLPDLQYELLKIRESFERLESERSEAYRVERREDGRFITPWNGDFSYSYLEDSAASLLHSMKLWRLQWRRNRINMEEGPGITARKISEEARRVIRVLEGIRDICRGHPGEYEKGPGSVRERYYALNEPITRGKASLRAIDRGFDDLCRIAAPEGRQGEAPVSVNQNGMRSAEALVDGLKMAASRAAEKNEKIILGLDWSWIPGLDDRQSGQRMAIQRLLAEILRLRKKGQLNNVIIITGRGEALAGEITGRAAETATPMSNIVVLGKSRDVMNGSFDPLVSSDPRQSAFVVGVDPGNITENSFIDIIGMIRTAVDLAFGEKERADTPGISTRNVRDSVWIFIPEAGRYDLDQLKRFYESQRQALVAA
ncbi:MAG: hypothetical protein GF392_04315 [Candidatus Omnitrophica bacterium]|nr:hypothetical protein [Candidatus Omnitrophota bacterium]